MNQTRWFVVLACGLAGLVSVAFGAESKSNFSLNPFAKSGSTKSSSTGVKSSSLWPTSTQKNASGQKKVAKRPAEPTMWDKFTAGTKSAFHKTTDALTFWDKDKSSAKKAPSSVRNRYGVQKKEETSSFWPSWLSGQDDEPKRPRTVSEFLNQEKPR